MAETGGSPPPEVAFASLAAVIDHLDTPTPRGTEHSHSNGAEKIPKATFSKLAK